LPALWASRAIINVILCASLAVILTAQASGASTTEDKPITIYADVVQGWAEDNQDGLSNKGLYAKGNVSIERGLTRIKLKEAIFWIGNPDGANVSQVVLYGEGAVTLEESSKPKRSLERVAIQWKTTGELRVIAPDKRSGQPDTNSPLYVRSRRVLATPPPPDVAVTELPPSSNQPAPSEAPSVTKPPALQTVKQGDRNFTQDPISPSPDVANILNRSSTLGISSRSSSPYQYRVMPSKPGEYTVMIWGGITLFAGDENSVIDISCDRAVIWAKGISGNPGQGIPNFSNFRKEQVEVYLEGHVEIRVRKLGGPSAGVDQLILADKGYYDLGRNTALLSKCELIYRLPGMTLPIHVQAAEVRQLDLNNFAANDAVFFASRLPSDPDIKVMSGDLHLELKDVPRKGLIGTTAFDPFRGTGIQDPAIYGTANNVQLRLLDFTVGAVGHAEGDLRDPFGPFEGVRFRSDNIFGVGMEVQLDALQLFGIDKSESTRWTISPLFYHKRGPGVITEFQNSGHGLLGFPGRYDTWLRGQLQWDYADLDRLGNNREPSVPQDIRGLLTLRHRQELDEHWLFQTQLGYQSDRNFYEQWWKRQYDEDLNQETFAMLKYQNEQFAMSALVKPNIRPWVNEGQALPRGDLWLVGQDLFETLTYYGHASAGLYRFNASGDLPDSYFSSVFPNEFDRYRPLPPSSDMPHRDSFWLSRFDIMNELTWPIKLGVMNLTPYGLADLSYYSDDMAGSDGGRVWWGYGARAAIPFSRLYSHVQSDFFNVRGIYHKLSIEADYRTTRSNQDFRRLPLIDRLDDDPTDQARRDLRMYRLINGTRLDLATSPLYDPQLYALRRGYLGSPDNLDDMEYVRFGVRNRWQTKRGIEEAERTVDWISFDLFATYFPDQDRDNYGNPFGLIDYNFRWQIGERTSILSQGYIDPFEGGARSISAGLLVERTERIRYYLGYYKLDPVGTDAVIFSSSYVISPKYSITWSSSYDFGSSGTNNLGQSLLITRTGSDVQVSLGLGWDPLRNNVNATFEVYPTVMGPTRHMRAMAPGLNQLDPSTTPY
jgi:hypothetical protein